MKGLAGVVERDLTPIGGAVCRDCGGLTEANTGYCECHLRGRALVALDRRRWPRLRLGTKTITGDEQWRPWLREASATELSSLLRLLGVQVRPDVD